MANSPSTYARATARTLAWLSTARSGWRGSLATRQQERDDYADCPGPEQVHVEDREAGDHPRVIEDREQWEVDDQHPDQENQAEPLPGTRTHRSRLSAILTPVSPRHYDLARPGPDTTLPELPGSARACCAALCRSATLARHARGIIIADDRGGGRRSTHSARPAPGAPVARLHRARGPERPVGARGGRGRATGRHRRGPGDAEDGRRRGNPAAAGLDPRADHRA